MQDRPVSELVDHLFRHQAGRLTSALTRVFGVENLDLAEDVTQEALIKALRNWSIRGVPDDPAAWLFSVARNAALDALRRRKRVLRSEPEIVNLLEARLADAYEHRFSGELADDQLRMMFTCCHPDVPPDTRVVLTLKTVGGFSVEEIGRAVLAKPTAISQRLVRAKRMIRDRTIPFAVPAPSELEERLESVLGVLYLMFNEGYSAHQGDDLVREDLCIEATRLAELVADHPVTGLPISHALVALLRLQGSRLASRLDGNGDLLLLADQDRENWDQDWIRRGVSYLETAAMGDKITTYHLEAGIAAAHATAPSFDETDWRAIVRYYDQLVDLKNSPIVALNRAVAIAMVFGPPAGLLEIDAVADHPALQDYYLLPATRGELKRRLGDHAEAAVDFRHALTLAEVTPVRRFLEKKLAALGAPV